MKIIKQASDIYEQCSKWRRKKKSIVLVPTMGYYHRGHEELMRYARGLGDKLVVSLFVNPLQFGANEDLSSYPRSLEQDCKLAKELGANAIFIPDVQDMYVETPLTSVSVPSLSTALCGKSRPTHFQGVCLVVLKLFMLTQANKAVFGQKDWQQVAILKRMIKDLSVPIEIIDRPIVREDDGLALSSRNVYLKSKERKQAPHIQKGLQLAKSLVQEGEQDTKIIKNKVLAYWQKNLSLGKVDYLNIVQSETLQDLDIIDANSLMACAVQVGKARLIDNIIL